MGHYMRECPLQTQQGTQPAIPPISQTTVQMERPANRGSVGRGRPQGSAPTQNVGQQQAPAPMVRGQGRVFAVNPQEAQASNTTITGIIFMKLLIFIYNIILDMTRIIDVEINRTCNNFDIGIILIQDEHAKVLFDSGATHSFISPCFAGRLNRDKELMENSLSITTPLGETVEVKHVYPSCVVRVEGRDLLADLIELTVLEFDVILGMDWLSKYHA